MTASPACLALIKRHEDEKGFLAGACSKLTAYKPTPQDVWTIGWGHTRSVKSGMTITAALADVLLSGDVEAVERDLAAVLACEVTQGQWDCLVSLGYNLAGGPRKIPTKAPKFWKYLHAGDKTKAAVELLDINHGPGGVVLAGLTRRRQAEAALFLS